ncbi:lipopolysaccharide biosynthesis protein [Vibrio caribbeanicus]|uniref:lipopolysaccharide biosynthesis protein n=1 Tax=Vibrio caribbeanicus TaxID=701175 RepID=UPI0022842D08|nr:oligosaccharide flippase family protein [Vibrio caribbeanicus]MCY9844240.1 hypothetical protein [Vibrio caribbeanicus]
MIKLISNVLGKLGVSLLMFASTPFLLKQFGAEQYGIIGIYIAIQMILMLVDGGFSTSYARDLSKENDSDKKNQIASQYYTIFIKLSCVVFLLAGIIILLILKDLSISLNVIIWMAISLSAQFMMFFYQASYSSQGEQVKYNAIYIFYGTVRYVIVTYLVVHFNGSIADFFFYQAILTFITCILYHNLISSLCFKLTPSLGYKASKRDNNMLMLLITTTVIYQIDKFIIFMAMGSQNLAYYSLAFSAAALPMIFISSFYYYSFPKFSNLIGKSDLEGFVKEFRFDSILLVSCILVPCIYVAYYSYDILFFWLGDQDAALASSEVFSILVLGNLIQGALMIPYCASVAFDKVKFLLKINLALLPILVLVQLLSAMYSSIEGVASAWLIFNIIFFLIIIFNLGREYFFDRRLVYLKEVYSLNLIISFVSIIISDSIIKEFFGERILILVPICMLFTLLCLFIAMRKKGLYE